MIKNYVKGKRWLALAMAPLIGTMWAGMLIIAAGILNNIVVAIHGVMLCNGIIVTREYALTFLFVAVFIFTVSIIVYSELMQYNNNINEGTGEDDVR